MTTIKNTAEAAAAFAAYREVVGRRLGKLQELLALEPTGEVLMFDNGLCVSFQPAIGGYRSVICQPEHATPLTTVQQVLRDGFRAPVVMNGHREVAKVVSRKAAIERGIADCESALAFVAENQGR